MKKKMHTLVKADVFISHIVLFLWVTASNYVASGTDNFGFYINQAFSDGRLELREQKF